MSHPFVRRQEGPITVVTLTRPPINALDRDALAELAAIALDVETDPSVRVLVLTSGLDGIFCSGGDLSYWREVPDAAEVSRAGREVFGQIEQLSKPAIAAINGHVIGDGFGLALACDLRIVSENAVFRLPEAGYGFIPGWGLISRLVGVVGRANASELLLTGRRIDATHALRIGLVTQVVSSEHLLGEVLRRAQERAALSPAALRAAKCALLGADEVECFESVWGKADWREGIDALLAKRTPLFRTTERGGEENDFAGRVQTDRAAGRRGCCS